jgi:serine/threonine protein kinase
MVSDEKSVRLIDFGLVVPNTPEFRRPGNRTGTASYMAPELIKRQPTDQRLDIFSYAVTCFEMYTKRFPWDAALTIDAVLQHINKPPVEITTLVQGIDKQIAAAIMKGLKANPDERWQKVSEMVAEIRDAEARLVKLAREAAARAAAAKPSGTQQTATTANAANPANPLTASPTAKAPAASSAAANSSATAPAAPSPPASGEKKSPPARRPRKSSPDDDIDLTAMFAE